MFKDPVKREGQNELFTEEIKPEDLDQEHMLIKISQNFNWDSVISFLSEKYCHDNGRPNLNIRLMVGLHILKYLFKLSDERTVQAWKENIYFQRFTGSVSFNPRILPCDPSSMTYFRKRIGADGCRKIFEETARIHGKKAFEKTVITDTTVQEKNITFPTDEKLLTKAIKFLSFFLAFVMPNVSLKPVLNKAVQLSRTVHFSKGKNQKEQKEKATVQLRTIAKTILDFIESKIDKSILEAIKGKLEVVKKVINQKKNDKDKIYSLHEPSVCCIAKGKSHKKYEFGSKVAVTIGAEYGVILDIESFEKNLYDGDTLPTVVKNLKSFPENQTKLIVGDRGYRGRKEVDGIKIAVPDNKNRTKLSTIVLERIKGLFRRRAAVEGNISHLKIDHLMSRNLLKGILGDKINALLAAAAYNLCKYAEIKDIKTFTPPTMIQATPSPVRRKFRECPLWRSEGTLFGTIIEFQLPKPEPKPNKKPEVTETAVS